MSDNTLNIEVNETEKRFEATIGDSMAFVEYQIAGKNILYTHTEVPKEYEGQGYANQLAHFAMEYAKENGYKVQPVCPFVKLYVSKHPEYHDMTWGF